MEPLQLSGIKAGIPVQQWHHCNCQRWKKIYQLSLNMCIKAISFLPLVYLFSSSDAFAHRVWSPGTMRGPDFRSHFDFFECGSIHSHTVPLYWSADVQMQTGKVWSRFCFIGMKNQREYHYVSFNIFSVSLQFKKHFRPARTVKPPRPSRPHHVCPQPSVDYPYWITSESNFDFRGI